MRIAEIVQVYWCDAGASDEIFECRPEVPRRYWSTVRPRKHEIAPPVRLTEE